MDRNQILWVAKSRNAVGSSVKSHTHPYYHMFLLADGDCRFVVGNTAYTLVPGQCLLVPPQTEHSFRNQGNTTIEYLEIKFSLPKELDVLLTDDPLVDQLFRLIVREYSALGSKADKAASSYLAALLNVMTQNARYEKKQLFRYVDASSASDLTQQIIHFLEAHYAEDLSLDMLAQAMGYNKSYLCVAFKKDVGFTILDCLNTIRIRRAAELIVYSDHSLPQVAELCGFASASHFNRVFLKYVGITPGQCRRAHPGGLYSEPAGASAKVPNRTSRFLYSVLAQKTITAEMIREMDKLEKLKPIDE